MGFSFEFEENMPHPYLTDEEVDHMTRGLKQPAAKVRFLQSLGLQVTRRPDGTPLVRAPEAARDALPPNQEPRWTR